MINRIGRSLFWIFGAVFLLYLVSPSPAFPSAPPGSLTSREPGDTKNPNISAYFTNSSRDEIINFYKSQFDKSAWFNLPLPTERLRDYPPEESLFRIREQTRSTYLEELVHPLRESIYINGFEPTDPKDAINIDGSHFINKVTIRVYPSKPLSRVLIGCLILGLFWVPLFQTKYLRALFR